MLLAAIHLNSSLRRTARCIEVSNGKFASRERAPFIAINRNELRGKIRQDVCKFFCTLWLPMKHMIGILRYLWRKYHLYSNASCLKEIRSPQFWPKETLGPIIAQYKKDRRNSQRRFARSGEICPLVPCLFWEGGPEAPIFLLAPPLVPLRRNVGPRGPKAVARSVKAHL